MTIEGLSISG